MPTTNYSQEDYEVRFVNLAGGYAHTYQTDDLKDAFKHAQENLEYGQYVEIWDDIQRRFVFSSKDLHEKLFQAHRDAVKDAGVKLAFNPFIDPIPVDDFAPYQAEQFGEVAS